MELNVVKEINVVINGVSFKNVTIFVTEYCLHIYSKQRWIDMISVEDIKSFNSSNPEVDYEVNQFLSELEYK